MNDPPADAFPLTTAEMDYQQEKLFFAERKKVDKIGLFQIDEVEGFVKIHGSTREGFEGVTYPRG